MKLVPFRCKAGEEYNELASLFFTDPDTAIKQREEGGKREGGRGRGREDKQGEGKHKAFFGPDAIHAFSLHRPSPARLQSSISERAAPPTTRPSRRAP